MKRIAIVGGGARGLFTARLLSEKLNDRIEITLFEAAPRLGQVVTGCFKKSGSHLSTRASTAGCAELLSPEDYYYDGSRSNVSALPAMTFEELFRQVPD
jgi:glycine/D-amino acid oxidase-like deaminating enzyme